MDAYDYMTNPSLEGIKTRHLTDDAPPRRVRRRQRDVSPKGQPVGDIARTMGYASDQGKYTGETFEEQVLRLCGYNTDAKVRALEGKA